MKTAVLHKLGELDDGVQGLFDPHKMAAYYEEKYRQLERLKRRGVEAQSLQFNPGMAWRKNECGIFPNPGAHAMYPGDGVYGAPAPSVAKATKNRRNKDLDSVDETGGEQ